MDDAILALALLALASARPRGGGGVSPSRPRRPSTPSSPPGNGPGDGPSPPVEPPVGRPVWPLASKSRSVTTDFGDPRPFGSKHPRRHHAGEDLRAPMGTIVRAPESGRVVVLRDTFYDVNGNKPGGETGLMMIDTGRHVVALGEIDPGSWIPFGVKRGSNVQAGQSVARVGLTAMLHFELYVTGVRTNKRWPWGSPQPVGLLNPTDYLVAAGGKVTR